jgi:hypothetical protein
VASFSFECWKRESNFCWGFLWGLLSSIWILCSYLVLYCDGIELVRTHGFLILFQFFSFFLYFLSNLLFQWDRTNEDPPIEDDRTKHQYNLPLILFNFVLNIIMATTVTVGNDIMFKMGCDFHYRYRRKQLTVYVFVH